MRIVTFNVNGVRSLREHYSLCHRWSFEQFLDSLKGDIICLQETKCNQPSAVPHELQMPHDWQGYWVHHPPHSTSNKQGYSGVVTFVRKGPWLPVAWEEGVCGILANKGHPLGGLQELEATFSSDQRKWIDSEARCLLTDHVHFVLLNAYYPNDRDGERTEYRRIFYEAVRLRVRGLRAEGRSVILVGDLNATAHPRDHCDFARHLAGISEEEIQSAASGADSSHELLNLFYGGGERPDRRWLAKLVTEMSDTFRLHHPERTEAYTCWNVKVGARANNLGTRLDYILLAGPLNCTDADLQPNIQGSDHCPVWAEFDLDPLEGLEVALPAGIGSSQMRLSHFFTLKKRKTSSAEGKDHAERVDNHEGAEGMDKHEELDRHGRVESVDDTRRGNNLAGVDAKNRDGKNRQVQATLIPQRIPLCKGHGEPCALKRVTAKGPKQGREFYTCARPLSHADDPAGQCNHFEWK